MTPVLLFVDFSFTNNKGAEGMLLEDLRVEIVRVGETLEEMRGSL